MKVGKVYHPLSYGDELTAFYVYSVLQRKCAPAPLFEGVLYYYSCAVGFCQFALSHNELLIYVQKQSETPPPTYATPLNVPLPSRSTM